MKILRAGGLQKFVYFKTNKGGGWASKNWTVSKGGCWNFKLRVSISSSPLVILNELSFSGKIPFHVAARTLRGWLRDSGYPICYDLPLFASNRHYSPLFAIDPLHKWRLNLSNNTHTSLASHSCENSFVLKHECEAKDVLSIVIQI